MARPAVVWVREQFVFLAVLAIGVAAFCYVFDERSHPVRGTLGVAAVSLVAAAVRAILPSRMVGLLAVRSRWLDTVCLAVLGVVILIVDIRLKH